MLVAGGAPDRYAAAAVAIIGAPCGTTRTRAAGAAGVDDHPPGGLGEHGDQCGPVAHRRQDIAPAAGVGSDSTVCSVTTNGWDSSSTSESIGAGLAAEDAVLVLDEHHVDVELPENPGGAHVVAPDRLGDRGRETRPLRAEGSFTITTFSTRSISSRPRRAERTSAAKAPIPQARGG